MKLPLNKREKIVLAKYFIYRLEDIYGKELQDSSEYKKYYLPLKNYIRNKLGKDQIPNLEQRIEIEYGIPLKYFDTNFEEIRDNEFPNLFKVVILNRFHFNENRNQWFTRTSFYDYYEDIAKHLHSIKNCSSEVLFDIPSPTNFARSYIKLKKMIEKKIDYQDDWCVCKFSDMNKFLIAITPTPLSDSIEKLLDQINQEKSNIDLLKKYPIYSIFSNIIRKDLKWSDIGFDYCSQDKIQIEIFAVKKKINIVKFGFKKSQNKWNLLFAISTKDGFIDYTTLYRVLETQKNYIVQKNISRLNKHFKTFFGIEENPIFYDYTSRCYQTKFLYIRNSYKKKANKLRESNEVYVKPEFEESDENIDC